MSETEKRRFIQTEEFMTKSWDEALRIMRERVPGVDWQPSGAFMDVASCNAYLTKKQAENAGLNWEDGV